MFKKFGAFYKIDNNKLGKSASSLAETFGNTDKTPYGGRTCGETPLNGENKNEADLSQFKIPAGSRSAYHDFLARHRRLSEEIAKREEQKNDK